MKPKQFLKYLESQGVVITQRTKHYRLAKNGEITGLTRSSSDIPEETIREIKKKLKIK